MKALEILLLLWSGSASAGAGTASPPPPAPTTVDLGGLPASASARGPEHDGKPHPVQARLLTDTARVAPGGTVRIGVHLTQDPEWHTYWKSPGDIGKPTEATWTLPAGTTAGPLQFPVPQRFEQDGMVSYGYDREVLLMADLAIPADATPGPRDLAADVEWLVCKTSCIPGKVHLELPAAFEVAGAPAPGPYAPLFDHYAAQHPTVGEVPGLKIESVLSTTALQANQPFRAAFVLRPDGAPLQDVVAGAGPAPWPTFTPIAADPNWWVTGVTVKPRADGSVAVVVEGLTAEPDPLPTSEQVGGLVQLKVGDRQVRTEVTQPLPWAPPGTAKPVSHAVFDEIAVADAAALATPHEEGDAEALPAVVQGAAVAVPATPAAPLAAGLLGVLVVAFVGGLILNVMPCVLPVLTLKLYGLVEQGDLAPSERRASGLAYAGGVVASFWALAAVVLIARLVFDLRLDWGSQFQYPLYVAVLATVVFAFGLSLLGVFEIPVVGASAVDEAAGREGLVGSFFTGVFATLLATPCSAPFLGTAVAYAFGAPPLELFLVMTTIGAGLAAPFLVIAFVPALFRFLPRPGEWMETLKHLLGFSLLLTAVWLCDVLMGQIGDRITWFWVFLAVVALACWGFGRFGGVAASGRRQLLAATGAGGLVAAGAALLVDLRMAEADCGPTSAVDAAALDFGEHVPWVPFSEPLIASLAGKPVFVDFTADWCITCKANERLVIDQPGVRQAMADLGVVPVKADWTRADPVITEWLHRNGRAGVPMYLVIPGDRAQPQILLPEVITQPMVVDALRQAAGS